MIYEKVLKNPEKFDFEIEALGDPSHPNPIKKNDYVSDSERISFSSQVINIFQQIEDCEKFPSFEKAGIRKTKCSRTQCTPRFRCEQRCHVFEFV